MNTLNVTLDLSKKRMRSNQTVTMGYAALITPLVSYCQSLEGRIRELEDDLPHAVEEMDRG